MLVGRHVEHEAVARLLARARDGHSGVLVVRGEAGIGKTAAADRISVAIRRQAFEVMFTDPDRMSRMLVQAATVASLGKNPGPTTIAFGG